MQRVRRTAVLAVLALTGVGVLTGCRSEPGVAIYVAKARYSQQRVDDLAQLLAQLPGQQTGDSRQSVVQWIVQRDIGKRIAVEQKWGAPQVDVDTLAGQVRDGLVQSAQQEAASKGGTNLTDAQVQQLTADITKDVAKKIDTMRPLFELVAESNAYAALAQQHATPVEPKDSDYADLYKRAKAAGLVEPGQDEATYRQSLGDQNMQIFAANIGLRDLYTAAIKHADVSINPKYAPAELVLLHDNANHKLVVIPLDAKGGSSPVSDG
jgi:hypothetical protein